MKTAILMCLLLAGCASTSQKITVTYETDRFGVPTPVVNGERYEMTDEERRAIGQAFVNEYCPAG